ncbi:MAG TPA: VWA domain-containing protein, partial [Chloroflexia bacterium]|nr:VWA domain-containing protein [Chloroflexia bacterium]
MDLPTALALLALDPALGGLVLWDADSATLGNAANALAALRDPPASVLRLPISVTPDHLLGGVNLAAMLRMGRRVLRPGLLAAYDGGILLLPYPDLLPPEVAGPLAATLRHGAVQLEHQGLSARLPARLLLVTTTPTGSPPRYPALLATAALWLMAGDPEGEDRIAPPSQPVGRTWQAAVAAARTALPAVTVAGAQIAALAATALRLGVPGTRPDYWAVRVARAAAALRGRTAVEDADLELAVGLVLAPRTTALPVEPPHAPPPAANPPTPDTEASGEDTPGEDSPEAEPGPVQAAERLIAAQPVRLPADVFAQPRARGVRRQATGGSGRLSGAQPLHPASHGRPGPPRANTHRPLGAALDLAATLEAAALRMAAGPRAVAPPDQQGPGPRVRLQPDDLRWRTPQAPPGVLFLLAVDASGSMARNRLGPAKGAAILLLERAYRHRDRVALLAIRGPRAQVLVPPTRAVARARRLLDQLPAGGGTPLASALATAWNLAAQAARTGSHTLLVLLTDGRANVPLAGPAGAGGVASEVAALAGRWAALAATGQAATLVVDTRLRYLGQGQAETLAQHLVGRYLYLPQATAAAIGAAADGTAAALGWRGGL